MESILHSDKMTVDLALFLAFYIALEIKKKMIY
jgi:hypothetical protein